MFTQLFGNYLLNEKIVTKQQLIEALEVQKLVKVKLGVLAINAGLMTPAQVDEVHAEQQRADKRFGDIAVEKGYLKEKDVDKLLSQQKSGQLILGQALVDKGYLTNEKFAEALNEYKKINSIQDKDFTADQNRKLHTVIRNFCIFNAFTDSENYISYISLLFKNIIRFIGDDFIPLAPEVVNSYEVSTIASQEINGTFSTYSAIEGDDTAMVEFASRYANEKLTKNDDFTQASVSEFLNLHNGLFTVNMSNEQQTELTLAPQEIAQNVTLSSPEGLFVMPICFPFGTISIVLSGITPTKE